MTLRLLSFLLEAKVCIISIAFRNSLFVIVPVPSRSNICMATSISCSELFSLKLDIIVRSSAAEMVPLRSPSSISKTQSTISVGPSVKHLHGHIHLVLRVVLADPTSW